jgi:hypothetical protein
MNDTFSCAGLAEIADAELEAINGGAFIEAAAAVFLACELYSWGYNYASSRLNAQH